jgi:hypothetical protein
LLSESLHLLRQLDKLLFCNVRSSGSIATSFMCRTINFANCRADFYRSISKLAFLGHVFHFLQTTASRAIQVYGRFSLSLAWWQRVYQALASASEFTVSAPASMRALNRSTPESP